MKATIKDVARECGVSITTVSLVLSEKPNRISETMKNKIYETAQELGYQPNQAAVSLVKQKSKVIGLVINDIRNTHIASLFMSIDMEIQKRGYSLMCHVLSDNDLQDDTRNGIGILDKFVAANAAAVIWGKPYDECDIMELEMLRKRFKKLAIPVATMDEYQIECPGIEMDFDYKLSGYMATKHLIEIGHTRIGCVAGESRMKVTKERLKGYEMALLEAGIPFEPKFIYSGNYTMDSGKKALPYLLGQKVSAIFSFNDEMAFGLYQSARQYGIKIPSDISVIGCDNVPFTDVMEVPLSTISVPIQEMGSVMTKELIDILEEGKKEWKKIRYQPDLFLRGSTAKV